MALSMLFAPGVFFSGGFVGSRRHSGGLKRVLAAFEPKLHAGASVGEVSSVTGTRFAIERQGFTKEVLR
jgi:hypothetical protein